MTLDELIATVSKKQKVILDEVWNYFVPNNSWPPAVALYTSLSKEPVLSSIKPLGGSVIYVSRNAGERERFVLTFLGVLLTTNGPALTLMFLQYLNYIKERLEADYELTSVDGAQVRERLQFDHRDNRLFMKALQLSPFLNGGSFGEDTWTAGLPSDADDLFSGVGIQQYFETKSLQNYDPSVPTEGGRRTLNWNQRAQHILPESERYESADEEGVGYALKHSHDVFLSYASSDSKQALQIYDSIVAAGGKVFLSEKHLKPGEDFAEAIRRALDDSKEVWLLLTPNSLTSEWVISEWGAAWGLRKPIVPILFNCVTADAPERIRRLHCIDFCRFEQLLKDRFRNIVCETDC